MDNSEHKKFHTDTIITHTGIHPENNHGFVNTPIYNSSTVVFPTLAVYDAAQLDYYGQKQKGYTGYTYARQGNPSARDFQDAIDALSGGRSVVFSSGLAAVCVALLSHLSAGDHLLITDVVYGPTRKFCESQISRFGIEVTFYDPLIGAKIKELIRPNTKVVYVESPGSLTLEVQDIPAIAEVAHKAGAIVMMDNSWATPLYYDAFGKGADVVIHSATKYLNGHSDLVMGVVSANEQCFERLLKTFRAFGDAAAPNECYLALRGLRTLAVRLERHQKTALKVAQWLKTRPEVVKVLHPALPDCPGHEVWKRDYTGSSGLFTFLTKPYPREKLAKMVDGLKLFKMGYSWGGFESLIIPFEAKGVRTASKWEHDGYNFRLSCGLEDADDLIADLKGGLERMAS